MKRRLTGSVVLISVLITCAVIVSGCSNNTGNEWQRVVCEVSSVNDGSPLVSAYLSAGGDRKIGTDDDFLPIDHVPVTFHARPYSEVINTPTDTPFSYFHITEYDVIWHPNAGQAGADSLRYFSMYDVPTDLLVPVGQDASVNILVADRYMKEFDFIKDLLPPASQMPAGYPWTGQGKWPFNASCELIFRGHETGSDEEIELSGAVVVSFIGVLIN